MQRPFHRLAVVNRGEPAMRVIHAVRELNQGRAEPIRVIALYTEPDRDAMFVRRADEAVLVGPARPGYLDRSALERALIESRADAAWVGWGFVAEDPTFVELCDRLDIVFVGPEASTMRALGDKIHAKRLAERAGVPVAPWSGGAVATVEEAERAASRIGYPLMVKAAAGGGGRGIRLVETPGALPAAFASARAEAVDAFGDDRVLLERALSPARHIEVQIIADGQGSAWAAGVRDCSVQRRHQKVLEESASPALDATQEAELRDAAVRLALRTGYRGAGTVEFLYQEAERSFSFMEVNARLQVEHPVTEAVTGLDLVKLQLEIAAGGRLDGDCPAPSGHAIEVRLCAEDPDLGFMPTPGRIALLRLPTGPGVRVDRGVAQSDVIPAEFDSMIAKLIAWGRTREEALARARRAVEETTVVIDGGTTNQGFLRALLDRPEIESGHVDTTWVDRAQLRGGIQARRHADVALVQAAIELSDAEVAADRARFLALARRGRPYAALGAHRAVELRHDGRSYRLTVRQVAPARYRITLDGRTIEASVARHGAHECRLTIGGASWHVIASGQGADLLVDVNGIPHRVLRDAGGVVRSLSPAMVVAVPVREGDEVQAGDVIAVVESMKMENSLTAPARSRVREVLVGANVQVDAHQPLMRLEPLEDGDGAAARGEGGDRVTFGWAPPPDADDALLPAEWLLLGYDVETEDAIAAIQAAHRRQVTDELLAVEERLLGIHADLGMLMRARSDTDEEQDPASQASAREHLDEWLRDLDAGRAALPPGFSDALRRALRHFGIEELERRPQLEAACHRLQLAMQRRASSQLVIRAILEHRLELALCRTGGQLRDALDRLISATSGRDAVVADLARGVRHKCFDEPLIARAREETYARVEQQLEVLRADPEASDGLVQSLVACPQPLAPRLTMRLLDAGDRERRALLEIMMRRYHRVRPLRSIEPAALAGLTALTATYEREGAERRLVAAFVGRDELARAADAFARVAAAGAPGTWEADLYVAGAPGGPTGDALADRVRAELEAVRMPPAVRRIVVAVAAPDRGLGMSAVELFTLRRSAGGSLREDRVMRGLHPLMAERLQLWRLSAFELERLPSVEDVYLFRGAARAHAKDQRLFAVAEVRDLTPVRDPGGRVTALPEFERMLTEALEGIRAYQAGLKTSHRALWNRILLHVWPVIDLSPEAIRSLVSRLAPATTGLGLELIMLRGRMRQPDGTAPDRLVRLFAPAGGRGVVIEVDDPPTEPLRPLDDAAQRIIAARRRGMLHPAEIVKLLAPAHDHPGVDQPAGDFVEHDLVDGRLVPTDRPPAMNAAGVVVGVIRNRTSRYPEGMVRVAILGDPTRALGALAEPECERIIAALDLADRMRAPVEWFALSAGAKIAMDSGTESMDRIAAVLRRIVEFTQRGGEINVVVCGINVGAQPYWNAEATMLMHTRGILVMTPAAAMVLTGKQSLDFSGGVSAEDNHGIGGYDRIMGPNGQAQYWAADLPGACRVLLSHYEHTYVAPGERFPRPAATRDDPERDVRAAPHDAPGSPLSTVGEIFSETGNAARKQPFDIRCVMRATIDADHPPLERWAGMADAETAVVWDAHLGGRPVMLIGFQGRSLDRHGPVPADGPDQWTSGTLFPRSSKKVARAINAASGRRPVVVLANLAGFDGSPESMRDWQLEFGAEIGRAVVNFDGPIVFCVVSRYHGGAFVVFSQALNENLETIAVAGAKASVIGGAPAAAVVFARDVAQAAARDPRVVALDERIAAADAADRPAVRAERERVYEAVHSETLGRFAARFDAVHSVERAVEVGSVRRIIAPEALRPELIAAVERGIRRAVGGDRDVARVAAPVTG